MRVHELAKELGINTKELMEKLSKLGVSVKSHMASIDEKTVSLVKTEMAPRKKPLPKDVPSVKEKILKKETPEEEKKPKEPEKAATALPVSEQAATVLPVSEQAATALPVSEKAATALPVSEKAAPALPVSVIAEEIPPEKKLKVEFPITAKEVALRLKLKPNELISKLISLGMFVSINQNLDKDTVEIILHEYGFFLEEVPAEKSIQEQLEKKYKYPDDTKQLVARAPVITFMGHVDHGKTLLLDTIRKTKVIEKEFGGITQHIGAYEVVLPKGRIVFLDTPGHAAFTQMRARGANITDIAVLVIAADEGIMPQTLEAIDHAKAAGIPIVVALNKIDKPTANPERVKRQLAQHEIKLEGWGGDVIACEVSAMAKTGIDHFLSMLLLQAEMLELKANPNRKASGTVIESRLTSDKGPIATVLVQNGTLNIGDPILCGKYAGKVKALINDRGLRISKAGPSTPVEVLGLSGTPDAGSEFYVTETEKEAKEISDLWQSKAKTRILESRRPITLADLYQQITSGLKELKLIVKGDVQGSVEALSLALERLSTSKVSINIIHSGVGDITESDVSLAMASSAIIVGFHAKANQKIKDICKKEMVDLRLYNIIYQAVEELMAAMEGLLEPKIEERTQGRALIRQIFHVSKAGTVAGCTVTEGKIVRNGKARLLRNNEIIHTDQIVSLKRLKEEAKEVPKGFECGLRIGNFEDYKEGDIVETYTLEKEEQKL